MFGFFNYSKVNDLENEKKTQQEICQEKDDKKIQEIYDLINVRHKKRSIIYRRFLDIELKKILDYVIKKNTEDENYDEVSDYEVINMKILLNVKRKGVDDMMDNYKIELQHEYFIYEW